ncbi:DNA-processing protein DprA [Roseovarius sp. ZX-A-9]|uniref:DNA-processing protein DprA n=1 Tax=Roseovarius sp. ZX-A-9 TaxID=3014783 RepID=UPI003FA7C6A9
MRSRRVGIATFYRLLAEHGTAQAALDALPDVARAAGVEDYKLCPLGVVHAELAAGRATGARQIFITDPDYPDMLRRIHDAPPMLWAVGNSAVLTRPMVAIVGARNAADVIEALPEEPDADPALPSLLRGTPPLRRAKHRCRKRLMRVGPTTR